MLILAAAGAEAGDMRGCWVVPETVLTEDRLYGLAERRELIGRALDRMKGRGIDTVFVESFVRGYATCRAEAGHGPVPVPLRFQPATRSEPDTLAVFVEEGRSRGLAVHAWVHMTYLRSDNITRTRADDDTFSLFHDLITSEFAALRAKASGRVRDLLDTVLETLERGYDSRSLAAALRENGHGFTHSPMQSIVDTLREAGLPGPALFTYGANGQLHPSLDRATNGSIYLDPAHPEVRSRLVELCGSIVELHPGLAGLHLDHIRFPEGDYGYVQKTDGGSVRFVAPPPGSREKAIGAIVAACKARVAAKLPLSAAVLPGYYQGWPGSGGSQRGAGQDWHRWDLSFYTPMLYGVGGEKLTDAMASYRKAVGPKTGIHPGIASLGQARGSNWVLFDYSTLVR